mmetsp:Transcript_43646/g.102957  ORF Transcript_43646/g.102957 Transcript_43646/m.102957 type:complete len:227 (-) Transcript_43646:169-849(-)
MSRFHAAILSFFLVIVQINASSVHVGRLCKEGTCDDPRFPMLDFDLETGKCLCRAHPCWNDNGLEHRCNDPEFPFLHFAYTQEKELQCSCSSIPLHDSLHVSRDLCPGHTCTQESNPILDYNATLSECQCRSDVCSLHKCDDPALPVRRYRREQLEDGSEQDICECIPKMVAPTRNMRGSRKESKEATTASCSWGAPSPKNNFKKVIIGHNKHTNTNHWRVRHISQ